MPLDEMKLDWLSGRGDDEGHHHDMNESLFQVSQEKNVFK